MSVIEYSVTSDVILDGSKVSAESWQVSFSADEPKKTWSVKLTSWHDISRDSTVTINRSFGPAPQTQTRASKVSMSGFLASAASSGSGGSLISGAHPDSWSADGSNTSGGMTISGTQGDTDGAVGSATLGVDTYFINSEYLDQLAPGGWTLSTDGAIYYSTQAFSASRVMGDGLPPKDANLGDFQCIVQDPSHYTVASWLAAHIGCDFVSNCDSVQVHRSFIVESDTEVLNALMELYRLWQPVMHVEMSPGGERPTIYVLDSLGSDGNTQAGNPINYNLSLAKLEVVNYSRPSQAEPAVIDHVIIKGAKDFVSDPSLVDYRSNLVVKTLDEVPLSEDFEHHWTESWNSAKDRAKWGDYTKDFGKSKEGQTRPSTIKKSVYYHVDPKDFNNLIIVREVAETYSDITESSPLYDSEGRVVNDNAGVPILTWSFSNQLTHVIETKHRYAKGFVPIGITESTRLYCSWPKNKRKELREVRRKVVDEAQVMEGVKRTIAREMVEEWVVANKVTPKDGSQPYYQTPITLIDAMARKGINTSPRTTQEPFTMKTKSRLVTVDRVTAGLLNQSTTEHDHITGASRTHSQILKDPAKTNADRNNAETQYTKHFYRGTANKKAITLEHPDITNDTLAAAVAERIFNRSESQKAELKLKLCAPFQIAAGAFTATIPDLEFHEEIRTSTVNPSMVVAGQSQSPAPLPSVQITTTETSTFIPGGKYMGISVDESLSSSGHEINLTLRSVL